MKKEKTLKPLFIRSFRVFSLFLLFPEVYPEKVGFLAVF